MTEHAFAQPKSVEKAPKTPGWLQDRDIKRLERSSSEEGVPDASRGTFSETRFGYDFSRVPAYTGASRRVRPVLRTSLSVQRFSKEDHLNSASCPSCADARFESNATSEESASGPEAGPAPAVPEPGGGQVAETTASAQAAPARLLVEDSANDLAPGQMRKREFLALLRSETTRSVESALAGSGRTTEDCPYLNYWFDFYSRKESAHIERTIHRYAPDASSATDADAYISIIARRARRAAVTWVRTGEITVVPEGVSTTLPGGFSTDGGESGKAAAGPVMFKSRGGGAKAAGDPQAIQAELGEGRPLEGAVRFRMESAFGMDFSHVRTHTGSTAEGLTNHLNARAFTVGRDIAFGRGEYKPGTPVGDALIAHELAHTVQQKDARASIRPQQTGNSDHRLLEADADNAALSVLASIWSGAKAALSDIYSKTVPAFRTGLRLQRCQRGTTTGSSTCAHPGHARSVDLQPVFFRSSAADTSPTGTSWTRRFAAAVPIWSKLGVSYTASSAVTLTDAANKTAGNSDAELLRIMGLRSGAGIEIFMVDNDINHQGGAATAGSGSNATAVLSDRGTSDTILAHELGHVLGLGHPPSGADSNTIMTPTGSHSIANPTRNTMNNYTRITWPSPGASTCLNPDT